jgi:hypothetical protein
MLAPACRLETFFSLWTGKESFAKASGRDLLEVLPERVGSELGWRVIPFGVSGAHVGAVTTQLASAGSIVAYEINVVDGLGMRGAHAARIDRFDRTVGVSRFNTHQGFDTRGDS